MTIRARVVPFALDYDFKKTQVSYRLKTPLVPGKVLNLAFDAIAPYDATYINLASNPDSKGSADLTVNAYEFTGGKVGAKVYGPEVLPASTASNPNVIFPIRAGKRYMYTIESSAPAAFTIAQRYSKPKPVRPPAPPRSR